MWEDGLPCAVRLRTRMIVYWPSHEYIADTLDGGIADILPSLNGKRIDRWARHPGEGEQLPLDWFVPERLQTLALPNNKLYAHCKCRGIEFWIARPADGSKYKAKVCACDSDRLGNGMEWFSSAAAHVRSSQIYLDDDGLVLYQQPAFGTLKTYCSSPTVVKGFCGVCGAAVFLTREGTDTTRIAVELLAAAEGARAETWLDWSLEELSSLRTTGRDLGV